MAAASHRAPLPRAHTSEALPGRRTVASDALSPHTQALHAYSTAAATARRAAAVASAAAASRRHVGGSSMPTSVPPPAPSIAAAGEAVPTSRVTIRAATLANVRRAVDASTSRRSPTRPTGGEAAPSARASGPSSAASPPRVGPRARDAATASMRALDAAADDVVADLRATRDAAASRTHARPVAAPGDDWLPSYFGALVDTARAQWLPLSQVESFLQRGAARAVEIIYDAVGPVGPPVRPEAGSVFIVDERRLPNWRDDGYSYEPFPFASKLTSTLAGRADGLRVPVMGALYDTQLLKFTSATAACTLVMEWSRVSRTERATPTLQRRAIRLPRAPAYAAAHGWIWLLQYFADERSPSYDGGGVPPPPVAPEELAQPSLYAADVLAQDRSAARHEGAGNARANDATSIGGDGTGHASARSGTSTPVTYNVSLMDGGAAAARRRASTQGSDTDDWGLGRASSVPSRAASSIPPPPPSLPPSPPTVTADTSDILEDMHALARDLKAITSTHVSLHDPRAQAFVTTAVRTQSPVRVSRANSASIPDINEIARELERADAEPVSTPSRSTHADVYVSLAGNTPAAAPPPVVAPVRVDAASPVAVPPSVHAYTQGTTHVRHALASPAHPYELQPGGSSHDGDMFVPDAAPDDDAPDEADAVSPSAGAAGAPHATSTDAATGQGYARVAVPPVHLTEDQRRHAHVRATQPVTSVPATSAATEEGNSYAFIHRTQPANATTEEAPAPAPRSRSRSRRTTPSSEPSPSRSQSRAHTPVSIDDSMSIAYSYTLVSARSDKDSLRLFTQSADAPAQGNDDDATTFVTTQEGGDAHTANRALEMQSAMSAAAPAPLATAARSSAPQSPASMISQPVASPRTVLSPRGVDAQVNTDTYTQLHARGRDETRAPRAAMRAISSPPRMSVSPEMVSQGRGVHTSTRAHRRRRARTRSRSSSSTPESSRSPTPERADRRRRSRHRRNDASPARDGAAAAATAALNTQLLTMLVTTLARTQATRPHARSSRKRDSTRAQMHVLVRALAQRAQAQPVQAVDKQNVPSSSTSLQMEALELMTRGTAIAQHPYSRPYGASLHSHVASYVSVGPAAPLVPAHLPPLQTYGASYPSHVYVPSAYAAPPVQAAAQAVSNVLPPDAYASASREHDSPPHASYASAPPTPAAVAAPLGHSGAYGPYGPAAQAHAFSPEAKQAPSPVLSSPAQQQLTPATLSPQLPLAPVEQAESQPSPPAFDADALTALRAHMQRVHAAVPAPASVDPGYEPFTRAPIAPLLLASVHGWRVRTLLRTRKAVAAVARLRDTRGMLRDVESASPVDEAFVASLRAQVAAHVGELRHMLCDAAGAELTAQLRVRARNASRAEASAPAAEQVSVSERAAARKSRLKGGALGRAVVEKYSHLPVHVEPEVTMERAETPVKPWKRAVRVAEPTSSGKGDSPPRVSSFAPVVLDLTSDHAPSARWRVAVQIVAARGLPPANVSRNGSEAVIDVTRDVYARVCICKGADAEAISRPVGRKQSTPVVSGTLTPAWDRRFVFTLPLRRAGLTGDAPPTEWDEWRVAAEVLDADRFARDTGLGTASIKFSDLQVGQCTESWVPLHGERARGQVCVRACLVAPDADLHAAALAETVSVPPKEDGAAAPDAGAASSATVSPVRESAYGQAALRRAGSAATMSGGVVSASAGSSAGSVAAKPFLKRRSVNPVPAASKVDWTHVQPRTVSRLDDYLVRHPVHGQGQAVVRVFKMTDYSHVQSKVAAESGVRSARAEAPSREGGSIGADTRTEDSGDVHAPLRAPARVKRGRGRPDFDVQAGLVSASSSPERLNAHEGVDDGDVPHLPGYRRFMMEGEVTRLPVPARAVAKRGVSVGARDEKSMRTSASAGVTSEDMRKFWERGTRASIGGKPDSRMPQRAATKRGRSDAHVGTRDSLPVEYDAATRGDASLWITQRPGAQARALPPPQQGRRASETHASPPEARDDDYYAAISATRADDLGARATAQPPPPPPTAFPSVFALSSSAGREAAQAHDEHRAGADDGRVAASNAAFLGSLTRAALMAPVAPDMSAQVAGMRVSVAFVGGGGAPAAARPPQIAAASTGVPASFAQALEKLRATQAVGELREDGGDSSA